MNNDFKNDDISDLIIERDGYLEQVKELEQELQRKDNNWNELKRYIKASDDCWDLQAVLDKIKEIESK